MAGKHDRRLSKVEYSLTPKQTVVLWLVNGVMSRRDPSTVTWIT